MAKRGERGGGRRKEKKNGIKSDWSLCVRASLDDEAVVGKCCFCINNVNIVLLCRPPKAQKASKSAGRIFEYSGAAVYL